MLLPPLNTTRCLRLALCVLIVMAALPLSGQGLDPLHPILGVKNPRDAKALEVVLYATKKAVADTGGVEAAGVGSWITQTKYQGPLSGGTSDHDMRLVMTGETDANVMLKKWKDFQLAVKENIHSAGLANGLSEAEVAKLINATNVYPPNQLMTGVEGLADAKGLFKKVGTVPNLGNGPVEGLFGPGGKGYAQYYEGKAGKLFSFDAQAGRVVEGGVDLTHLIEGIETATTAGEVNKAVQFGDKVLDLLENNDVRAAVKQAGRLQDSIRKGRALEQLGTGASYLDDIVKGTETNPDVIRSAIARAKDEARLVLAYSQESGPRAREVLRAALTNAPGPWAEMKGILWKYAGKVPVRQLMAGFMAYSLYAQTHEIAGMTGAQFDFAVRSASATQLAWMVGPLAGIGVEIANAVLTAARGGMYNLVTAFQDCTSLIEGVGSVKGREALYKGMTVDQMARTFPDTVDGRQRMLNFIHGRAGEASYREERGQFVLDPEIQKALIQKCTVPLQRQWAARRMEWIDEFNAAFLQLNTMVATDRGMIIVDPSDVVPLKTDAVTGQKRAVVTLRVGRGADRAQGLLTRMRDLLKRLDASTTEVLYFTDQYALSVDGAAPQTFFEPSSRSFTYTEPGEHSAQLVREFSLSATVQSDDATTHTAFTEYRKVFKATGKAGFSIIPADAEPTTTAPCATINAALLPGLSSSTFVIPPASLGWTKAMPMTVFPWGRVPKRSNSYFFAGTIINFDDGKILVYQAGAGDDMMQTLKCGRLDQADVLKYITGNFKIEGKLTVGDAMSADYPNLYRVTGTQGAMKSEGYAGYAKGFGIYMIVNWDPKSASDSAWIAARFNTWLKSLPNLEVPAK